MANVLTLTQIAFELGAYDRITKESTKPLHAAYAKAQEADQKAMRTNWILGYMAGNLDLSYSRAEALLADHTVRELSATQRKAYDRARQQFKYHVERPTPMENSPQGAPDDIANLLKIARIGSANLKKAQQKQFAEKMLALLAEFDLIETE